MSFHTVIMARLSHSEVTGETTDPTNGECKNIRKVPE
jgi:hypothetical protein